MQYPVITGNSLLDRAYQYRNIYDKEALSHTLKDLLPITSLTQIEKLSERLLDAVQKQKRIIIIADYDCDGATACAVMARMLMSAGANVGWLVPDRAIHGYGLTPKIVDEAYQGVVTADVQSLPKIEQFVKENALAMVNNNLSLFQEVLKEEQENVLKTSTGNQSSQRPDVILTVDNGIASVEGVNHALSLGLEVLVTDHHLAGKTIPPATAIVNPNHPDCRFISKALCGVGVAWYVCAQFGKIAKQANIDTLDVKSLLPLVALGTVADVVSLDENNRILVNAGLEIFRHQKSIVGLEALVEVAGLKKERFSSVDIGFQVGPRINAAGRIKNMGIGILNLVTDDSIVAYITAAQLNHLNVVRKEITKHVTEEGEAIIQSSLNRDYSQDTVIVLYPSEDEEWHEGVIGIVAGRLKEKFNKPSIVMTYIEEDHLYKGSCRSIPSLHFKDLLDEVANEDGDIFAKYGGHAMAAGLSVHADKIHDFIRIINEKASEKLNEADFKKYKISDGMVSLSELSLSNVLAVQQAVWGQNFPYPQFHGTFTIVNTRRMGGNEEHLKITLRHNNYFVDAVRFNCPNWQVKENDEITILFQPTINEWNDKLSVNLLIQEADFDINEPISLLDLHDIQAKIKEEKQLTQAKNSLNFNEKDDVTISKQIKNRQSNDNTVYFFEHEELKSNNLPDFD